jgi:hypothetical protein
LVFGASSFSFSFIEVEDRPVRQLSFRRARDCTAFCGEGLEVDLSLGGFFEARTPAYQAARNFGLRDSFAGSSGVSSWFQTPAEPWSAMRRRCRGGLRLDGRAKPSTLCKALKLSIRGIRAIAPRQ